MTDLILKLCPEWVTYTDVDKCRWIMICVIGPICFLLYLLWLELEDVFYELSRKREYKKLMSQRENKGPTMEDCETFHHANIQPTKEILEMLEKRKALLDMVTKTGSWVNTPESSSPINKSNLMAKFEPIKFYNEPTTFTTLEELHLNETKEIKPVKCKCCGASINLAKMVCEYCDTPYERS